MCIYDLVDGPVGLPSTIRRIVETSAADGYRLRDLVLLCVESDIFRQK